MNRELVTAMDLLPTIAALVDAPLPEGRTIDGHDISALLSDEDGATSPTDHFLYYSAKGELAAIRRGAWKLMLQYGELYDVEVDVSEQWNLAEKNPEQVAELRALAEAGDGRITAEARPVRHVEETLFDPRKPED